MILFHVLESTTGNLNKPNSLSIKSKANSVTVNKLINASMLITNHHWISRDLRNLFKSYLVIGSNMLISRIYGKILLLGPIR